MNSDAGHQAALAGATMNYSMFFLCTAVSPSMPSQEIPDASAHRCEALLLLAINAENPYRQRCLIVHSDTQLSHFGATMSTAAMRRIGFLAGILIETALAWDCRECTVSLFAELTESEAAPAFGAIPQLLQEAKERDDANDKRATVSVPVHRTAPRVERIFARFERLWPSNRRTVDQRRAN
jgi:hypothetical protein